jgi:SAM-dependent methyltransferase
LALRPRGAALAFGDGAFDVVVANHMLYRVPDRPRAFAEIRRVLADAGRFHAATNGRGHLAELAGLVPGWSFADHVDAFGLETGPPQLEAFFADVPVEAFEDWLEVTETEPVLAYIRSSFTYRGGELQRARETVEDAIDRDGCFRISKSSGLISSRVRESSV